MVGRIGEVLRLQAQPGAMREAADAAVQEVAGIELQAGLRGMHFHRAARRRIVQRGDAAQALALYRSAAEVRWTPTVAERIAAAETRLGHEDLAEVELTAYLAQHPQECGLAALVGRAAAARGDWTRAALMLGHAAELPGGASDPRLIADLAEAQMHLGDGERALGNARLAYAMQRASPRTTRVLAAVLSAADQRAGGAEVLLAKARALGDEPVLALR